MDEPIHTVTLNLNGYKFLARFTVQVDRKYENPLGPRMLEGILEILDTIPATKEPQRES